MFCKQERKWKGRGTLEFEAKTKQTQKNGGMEAGITPKGRSPKCGLLSVLEFLGGYFNLAKIIQIEVMACVTRAWSSHGLSLRFFMIISGKL